MICQRRLAQNYSSDCSKEVWVWTFMHASWTLQYVSEGIFFSKLLEEGPICGPVFKNVGERFTVVSKNSEKPVNNTLIDHLKKYDLFPDFQYGFRFYRSTADLVTRVSDRIAGAVHRSGLLELKHLIYPWLLAGLACWSSSKTQILWNFRLGASTYFDFSQ